MKRAIFTLLIATLILIGCGISESANASKEVETYLDSVDEYKGFNAIKLVDKETGCKYLIIKYQNNGHNSVTQMLDKDGKPLCK